MLIPHHFQPATRPPSRLLPQEKALGKQNAGACRWNGEPQGTEVAGPRAWGRGAATSATVCVSYSSQTGKSQAK